MRGVHPHPLYFNAFWCNVFYQGVLTLLPKKILSDEFEDKVLWINKDNKDIEFSVKEAWKALRIDSPKVIW